MRSLPLPLLLLVLLPAMGLAVAPSPAHGDAARDRVEALKRGLKADDEAARLAALEAFRPQAVGLPAEPQRGAARALRAALGADPSPGVRREAVRVLARVGGHEAWVGVLLCAREETEPGVRKAARLEVLGARGELLTVASRLLTEDEDATFRADLLLLLGDRRRSDALPLLLGALRDPHPRVVAAAAEALEAITGEAEGYDPEAWVKRVEARGLLTPPPPPAPGATVEAPPPTAEPAPHLTRSLVPDFLGLPLVSKDYVFVVDVSGSVGPGAGEGARRALERAVERLGSDVRFTALMFADEIKLFRPDLVPAVPRAKEDLHLFLRGVAAGGRTDLFTSVNVGLDLVRKRVAAKQAAGEPIREAVTLVVVSDGRDNAARTPTEVLAERLERLDLKHAVVHAVLLGGQDHPFMRALARRTGGRFVVAPSGAR